MQEASREMAGCAAAWVRGVLALHLLSRVPCPDSPASTGWQQQKAPKSSLYLFFSCLGQWVKCACAQEGSFSWLPATGIGLARSKARAEWNARAICSGESDVTVGYFCFSNLKKHMHSRGLGNSQVATTINTISLNLIKLWEGFQASDHEWHRVGQGSGASGGRCLYKAGHLWAKSPVPLCMRLMEVNVCSSVLNNDCY